MKRLMIITLFIALISASILPVMADELDNAKNQKSTVDNRISKLSAQKKQVMNEKARLERQKSQVISEQTAETNAYQELLTQINEAEEDLRQTEKALEEAIAIYNKQEELFKLRLKVMYQNTGTTKLDTLLESDSIVEFYERLEYMSIISKHDRNIISDLNDAKADVDYKRKLQQQAKENLELLAKQKQEHITSLKASRSELENEISRSTAALNKLENEIDAQLAESRRLNGVIKNLSTRKKYVGGSMTWPVPSSTNITSSYGMRKHPILRKYKMHTGIDIAASKNSSIVAANSGTVIMAKYDNSGYGRMVVIDHGNGITTLYAHCNSISVKVGQEVKKGNTIAKVGSTGLSTGNHLHFEIRVNGETKNPLSSGYLTK